MQRKVSLEFSDFSKLSNEDLLHAIDNLPFIGVGENTWIDAIFILFLNYNKITSKLVFMHTFFLMWHCVQLFAACNSLPLILTIVNKQQDIVSDSLLAMLTFNIPRSLDQSSIYYIATIFLFTFTSIFVFWISVYRIKMRKPFHAWQVILSYIFSVEFSRLLLAPNVIFSTRLIVCTLTGIYKANSIFILDVILIICLIRVCYYTGLFNSSYFKSRSMPRTVLIYPEHIQLYALPMVGWGLFTLGNLKQGCTCIVIISFLLMVGYFYWGMFPKTFRYVIDPLSLTIGWLLFFESCAGIVFAKGLNKLSYTHFIAASITIAMGVYLIMYYLSTLVFKRYNKKLNAVTKFSDLNIKSQSKFLKYLTVAFHSHHALLYDGSMILYAHEHFQDVVTNHMLLRLSLYLPLDIQYIHLIEEKMRALTVNSNLLSFYLYEYITVKRWRSQGLDANGSLAVIKTTNLIKSFINTVYSYSSFIQQEGTKSSFIFGQALSEFATTLESHIDRFLLFYPTHIDVLKMSAYFYDVCTMDKQRARVLHQKILFYEYLDKISPNWRVTESTIKVPITPESSEESVLSRCKTESVYEASTINTTDKSFVMEQVFTETRSWISINMVIMFCIVSGVFPFVITVFISCRSYQKDYRALVEMTQYFSEHAYYFCGLLTKSLEPGFNSTENTEEERTKAIDFVNGFVQSHIQETQQIMLLTKHYRNLNKICGHLWNDQYFNSHTAFGAYRVYNHDAMIRKLSTVVLEVLTKTGFDAESYDYRLVVDMFSNVSEYFAIFLDDYDKCLVDSYALSKEDIFRWGRNAGLIVISIMIALMMVPMMMNILLRKMNQTFKKTSASNESRLIEVTLSHRYKSNVYYNILLMILYIVNFFLLGCSFTINRYFMLQLEDTVKAVVNGDLDDVTLMGTIGEGLISIELKGMNSTANVSKLLSNVRAVTEIWYQTDASWRVKNNSTIYLPMFEIVSTIMNQLKGEDIVYNGEMNKIARNDYNAILREMMKERILNRTTKYWDERLYVNIINAHVQTIIFAFVILVFYSIGQILAFFTQSVIYTEYILKMIPFVRQKGDTSTIDSMRIAGSFESKSFLDVLGVPCCLVDKNDTIIFANHEWLSLFIGTQTNFVGKRYQLFTGNDPDIVTFSACTDKKLVTINRSAKIVKLRKKIDFVGNEYKELNESAMPVNVLSGDELEKDVICATISIISANLQNEDIDLVKKFTDNLFERIGEELEDIDDCKLFMWSYSDITIAFGFNDTPLDRAALQAINIASICTQLLIETEEIYGLYCASSIMIGKVGANFDGAKPRSWRISNSITLSERVAHIVSNYIADVTYVLDNEIAIIILESEEEYIDDE